MFRGLNIKKVAVLLAIVMVASFALAAVIFVADYGFDGFKAIDGTAAPENAVNVDEEKTEALSGIKKLNVKIASEDITFIASDSNELKAHFYGWYKSGNKNFKPEFTVEKLGDALTVKISYPTMATISYSSRLKLDIYLPRSYSEDLQVNATSADITIDEMNLNSFLCKVTSGDITARLLNSKKAEVGATSGNTKINGKFESFTYNATSGDFSTEGITAAMASLRSTSGSIKGVITSDTVQFSTTSGDITMEQLTAGKSKSETSSGSTVLKGNPGEVEASATSGDISLEYTEFRSNIKTNTTSGKTSILLPPHPEFALSFKTASGEGKCDFPITMKGSQQRRGLEGVVTSERNSIMVTSTSGDLTIRQK